MFFPCNMDINKAFFVFICYQDMAHRGYCTANEGCRQSPSRVVVRYPHHTPLLWAE